MWGFSGVFCFLVLLLLLFSIQHERKESRERTADFETEKERGRVYCKREEHRLCQRETERAKER